jgi:hypothetical protein
MNLKTSSGPFKFWNYLSFSGTFFWDYGIGAGRSFILILIQLALVFIALSTNRPIAANGNFIKLAAWSKNWKETF